jgi:hypothetical protein
MIYLHSDRDEFRECIIEISEATGVEPAIIEKDYYVTLMLNILSEREPRTIFKGGTSLSKCYSLIDRFSEDIDLNYDNGEKRASENMRVRFSHTIRECAEELGFKPINFGPDHPLHDKKRFIRYYYDYDPIFTLDSIKSRIEIETAFFAPSFPIERRPITSIAERYLNGIDRSDLADEFGLTGHSILVQSIERTYIDKLFAFADYYLDDNISRHSRYLYDLYRIAQVKDIKDIPEDFIASVRSVRAEFTNSRTSHPEYDLVEVLQEVLDQDIYKEDYNTITIFLLYREVDYETAKESLQNVVNEMSDMQCFRAQAA